MNFVKIAAGSIGALVVLMLWYVFADMAKTVSAGGPAFAGNMAFLLALPVAELALVLLFGLRWTLARRPTATVLWRLSLFSWPFAVANVLFVAYLVGTGAIF